jgi:putative PIN family toxin of toxin-antitoxin system
MRSTQRSFLIPVVFDANILIQAAISGRGPAYACLELVEKGAIELSVTESILDEVEEILHRLSTKRKYSEFLVPATIEKTIRRIREIAKVHAEPPHVFDLARDRDDEVYVDLAVATGAVYLTSRDRDLLDLMDPGQDAGRDFLDRYPNLRILDPLELLQEVRKTSG